MLSFDVTSKYESNQSKSNPETLVFIEQKEHPNLLSTAGTNVDDRSIKKSRKSVAILTIADL